MVPELTEVITNLSIHFSGLWEPAGIKNQIGISVAEVCTVIESDWVQVCGEVPGEMKGNGVILPFTSELPVSAQSRLEVTALAPRHTSGPCCQRESV